MPNTNQIFTLKKNKQIFTTTTVKLDNAVCGEGVFNTCHR